MPPAVLAGFILSIPEEPIDPAKLQRVVYTPVRLPDLRSQITLSTPVNEPMTRDTPVRDHDTLTSLFARLKIRDPAAFDFVTRDPGARELVIPRKGGFATADLAADGSLNRLSLFYDTPDTAEGRVLEVTRMDDGQSFAVNTSPFAFDVQTALVSGTVLGSPDASFNADAPADGCGRSQPDSKSRHGRDGAVERRRGSEKSSVEKTFVNDEAVHYRTRQTRRKKAATAKAIRPNSIPRTSRSARSAIPQNSLFKRQKA